MSIHHVAIAIALTMGVADMAHGQASLSAKPAETLVRLLQERKMQHVAAADPGEEGRYVAAMLAGDAQLFLVSARYAQPVLLNERLLRGDYVGAYTQLNSASVRKGKLFIQDLGKPGLHVSREPDKPFDVVYVSGTTRTAFDGDWKAQHLSEARYQSAFADADKQYARALDALVTVLGRAGGEIHPGSAPRPAVNAPKSRRTAGGPLRRWLARDSPGPT